MDADRLGNGGIVAEATGVSPIATRVRTRVARTARLHLERPTLMGDLLVRMLPLERADSAKGAL
jgi:hypothetical protein